MASVVHPQRSLLSRERLSSLRRCWATLGTETCWVLTGQMAAGIGSLLSVRVLTDILPPAEFGQVALCLSVVLVLQYCYAGTSAAAMRFYAPAVERGQFSAFLEAAWRQHHPRGLLAAPFAVAGLVYLLLRGDALVLSTGVATLATAAVTSYNSVVEAIQNGARRRIVVALHQGLGTWLRLGIAVSFVPVGGANAASVMWGFAAGAAAVSASQFIFYRHLRRQVRHSIGDESRGDRAEWQLLMSRYARPYLVWAGPAWLHLSLDRWLLLCFSHASAVGIYAALNQLAFLPITTVTQLITQVVAPISFSRAGDLSDEQRVTRSQTLNTWLVYAALLMTALSAALTAVFRGALGHLFLDVEYHEYLHLLPLMVLAAGILAATQLAEMNLLTAARTDMLIWPKAIVGLVSCCAAALGAYLGGITAVVWVGVAGRLALLIWISVAGRWVMASGEIAMFRRVESAVSLTAPAGRNGKVTAYDPVAATL